MKMKTMPFTRIAAFAWILFSLRGLTAASSAETVGLSLDSAAPQIAFAAGNIKAALEKRKHTVETHDLAALAKAGSGRKIVLALASDSKVGVVFEAQSGAAVKAAGEQAYAIRTTTEPDFSYWMLGGDANGAMYGAFQIAEQIAFNSFQLDHITFHAPRPHC